MAAVVWCQMCQLHGAGNLLRRAVFLQVHFVINPSFTLKPALALTLPQMVVKLRQDKNAAFGLESGG